MYIITVDQLVEFFHARAVGCEGPLARREFPAARFSFARIPCQVQGRIEIVRTVPDVEWPENRYDIYRVPRNNKGCVVERETVSRLWRFVGVGYDKWAVEAPTEEWRLKNAFEGKQEGLANSDYGPFGPYPLS